MDDITVTPEMIKAGVDWLDNHTDTSSEQIVVEVYRAMERVRHEQINAAQNELPTLIEQMIANSPRLQAAQKQASEFVLKHVCWEKAVD